jgi:hypothetical protein
MFYAIMRHSVTIIILFFLTLAAKADQPGPAYQYDLYSENQKYFFKSVPFYNYSETDFGKTTVYDNKTKKPLYKIDNYLPSPSFLNNNGKSLITTKYWLWGHDNFDDQVLLQFYINGKKAKKYYLKDLINDNSVLQPTSSHSLWFDEMFIHLDTFYVLTLENKTISFNANTGALIGKTNSNLILKRFNKDKLPQLKKIYLENIKYPDTYQFPNLTDNRGFHNSLIKGLKKTEVKDYDSCKFYISIGCVIDRQGKCEIFYLNASINHEDKDNEIWKSQVQKWVLRQKYKTNLIPKNCDKWVFEEFFYLK